VSHKLYPSRSSRHWVHTARLKEKPGQSLSTQHVGLLFPGTATLGTAMKAFRNSGLWPADRCAFTEQWTVACRSLCVYGIVDCGLQIAVCLRNSGLRPADRCVFME
jgi:hypothetical protein